ncbi:MAG: rRNA maturation RNase YbeY [Acidobacteria bacterium]|nr:rRNA maturation RNase YbeY [Acidobacteriota bacterium]
MSPEGSSILFDRAPGVDRKRIRAFHARLIHEVTSNAGFDVLVSNDARLHQLNRDFLGHDYPTDVLSFPNADRVPLGEVAISVNRAAAQAADFGHTVNDEIEILMLHGALHLMGMDHETDKGAMARAEKKWRELLALPRALTERTRGKSPARRKSA